MKTLPGVVSTGAHYDLGCILKLSPSGAGLAFLQAVVMRITLSVTRVRNVGVSSANLDIGKDDEFGLSR